jgi:hypothetical protein
LLQAIQRERRGREHLRRAVVEGEAFLEREPHGREAGAFQRCGARQAFALAESLAFAEQHDGKVRQRRQIAARADRALLGNHRNHIAVEQFG